MKMVMAIIKPFKLDDVREALSEVGVTGVFADAALGGVGLAEGVSMGAQVGKQAMAVLVTCAWSGAVTFIAWGLVNKISPMRIDSDGETEGLDLVLHDERGYNL